jgi:hypothetical protein
MNKEFDTASVECEELFKESLSESKLVTYFYQEKVKKNVVFSHNAKVDLTGATNLSKVNYLELKVDSRKIGFGNLGKQACIFFIFFI